MKTLTDFNKETLNCSSLDEFVLTPKEWGEYESGTEAYKVETYNPNGDRVAIEYVLKDIENEFPIYTDEVLEDMQYASDGYFTDTSNVKRK